MPGEPTPIHKTSEWPGWPIPRWRLCRVALIERAHCGPGWGWVLEGVWMERVERLDPFGSQ